MSDWAKRVLQRYRYPHTVLAVLLVLAVLMWIENISMYLTNVIIALVVLYPLHGSAMLVLGALLSVIIGLESSGTKPAFYGPDMFPAIFFLALAMVVLRWKIVWERKAGLEPIDRQWKELVGWSHERLIVVKDSSVEGIERGNGWIAETDSWTLSPGRLSFCLTAVAGVMLCIVVAGVVSAGLPLEPQSQIEYRLPPLVFRTICFACVLLAGFCIAVMLVRHVEWRSLDSAQARVHLNGFLQMMLGRDVRRFHRVWRKQRSK